MHSRQPILLILVLLPLFSARLFAKPGDDGTLYFPPKLVVEVQGSTSFWHSLGSKDTAHAKPLSELLFLRWVYIRETPLLPMVFFDFGSSDIPERYSQFYSASAATSYTDTGIGEYNSEIDKYRDILNVLGYRMKRFPSTFVELQGSWSFDPGENQELARERAEIVRDYLARIWKIDTGRIRLLPPRQRCRPEDNLLLQEESQAVMINASSWELVRPVNYQYNQHFLERLEFTIVVDPNDNPQQVAAIEILMRCEDTLVGRMELAGSPDSTLYRFRRSWDHSLEFVQRERTELEIEAVILRRDGTTCRSEPVRIPVLFSQTTADGRELTYKGDRRITFLPFFSAGQTDLNPLQKLLLRERIQQILAGWLEPDDKCEVTVVGLADISDAPALPDALIRGRHWTYRNARDAYNAAHDASQSNLHSLYIPTPAPALLPEDDDAIIEEILRERDRDWYGNQSDNLVIRHQAWNSVNKIDVDTGIGRMLDTVSAMRESEPARLIDSLFGNSLTDTVLQGTARFLFPTLESNEGNSCVGYLTRYVKEVETRFSFRYTPEERFYNRQIQISLDKRKR